MYDPEQARKLAEQSIRDAVQAKDNPADLINVALEELVRARLELPGFTTLDEMAATIRAEVNAGFHATVYARIAEADRLSLAELLRTDPVTRRSRFDDLKRTAGAASLSRFKEHLTHLTWFDALGPTAAWVAGVPPAKVSHFAAEARGTDAGDMRKISQVKQVVLVACLAHVARTRGRDELATMYCKRMAAIHKQAKDKFDRLRESSRAEAERLVDVCSATCSPRSARDRPVRRRTGQRAARRLRAGVDADRPSGLGNAVGGGRRGHAVAQPRDGRGLPRQTTTCRSWKTPTGATGRRCSTCSTCWSWCRPPPTAPWEMRWRSCAPTAGGSASTCPTTSTASRWTCRSPPSSARRSCATGLVRRHFEACVFSYLAAELRSGDIAVAGSESYANLNDQLLTWSQCEPLVADYCAEAGLPATAVAFRAAVEQQLTGVAAAVDAGYPDNADLLVEGTRPVLRRRRGKERRPSALALEKAVLGRLPERGILDVLTRVAYLTGWPRHFGPVSGSDPKIDDPVSRYVLLTFTYGTNLGPYQVARHMPGVVSAHQLATAVKHAGVERIDAAKTDVVNAFAQLDLPRVWGEGR